MNTNDATEIDKDLRIKELEDRLQYLDSIASELQDICDKQAKNLGEIHKLISMFENNFEIGYSMGSYTTDIYNLSKSCY